MGRFVEAADRRQPSLLPACLDDYVGTDNPVRVIDAFVDELALTSLSFLRVQPAATGRPGYAPCMMLKLSTSMAICIRWRRAESLSGKRGATSS